MKQISFELTMPNVGSWNGKWTGAQNKYYVIRKFDNQTVSKLMENARLTDEKIPYKSHHYNFGDGWSANVTMQIVDAKEANKRRKISSGFCGYEWMIDSIISHGQIQID